MTTGLAPLRFEDRIEVHLVVRAKHDKAIEYRHVIRKLAPEGPQEVARGTIVVVCARIVDGQPLKAIPIPDKVGRLIEAAPADMVF